VDDLKQQHAAMWGTGDYERIAETLAPMHDELIRHLAPQPGERWLDVAAGTGELAFRAARKGARVTAVDLAPALIARARTAATRQGLDIAFEVGDAERLEHSDAAFDVVVSSVGVIFAPDHRAVARELARVCRLGGRLGVSAWRFGGGVGDYFQTMAPFRTDPPPDVDNPFDWGREQYVNELLAESFELEVLDFDSPFVVESSVAAWDKLSTSYGPTMTLAASLSPARREDLRRAVISFYDRFWTGTEVHHARGYAMWIGTRR
jgi:SAM-dependent methyltransferase